MRDAGRATRLLGLTIALAWGTPGPGPAQDLVLLDEEWAFELMLNEVKGALIEAEEEGVDLRVKVGSRSALLQNDGGAPTVRFRDASPIDLSKLQAGATKLRMWYRTDNWDGTWQVRIFTYYRPVSDRTFALLEGDLDGGGENGRLIPDDRWHQGMAALQPTPEYHKVDATAVVPTFVMLVPKSGWNKKHRTYVDHVSLVGLAESVQAPARPTEKLRFPESIDRPRPVLRGRTIRVGPANSIQDAVDRARPGDTVSLTAGTYYQSVVVNVSGKPGSPIALRAEEPGAVTITGGTPPEFRPEFEHTTGGIFKASLPWRVRWVMTDGRNLIGYESLDGLKTFHITGHDSKKMEPGPPEGFAWENGSLYVRLLGGQDPNEAQVEIHRQYSEANADLSATEYWGKPFRDRETGGENLRIDGSHVIVSGLRLRLAPEVAARVAGDNVAIEDCLIEGAFRGVKAGDAANLQVERCEFGCYPGYQWVRWGQSEYPDNRSGVWNAVYNSNLCTTFLEHSGPGAVVRRNLVYECFDGVQRHAHDRSRPVDAALASEFSHNVIASCGDECIEFDSTGPQILRVHHNFFMDALALLALSPVQGGHLMVDHNIAYVSPEYGLMPCTLLKFDCPWRKRWISTPTRDCVIVHNTMVNGRVYLYWTGEDHSFADNVIENNLIWVRLSFPWRLPMSVSAHNLYAGPNVLPDHLEGVIQSTNAGFQSEPTVIPLKTPRLPVIPLRGLVEADPAAPTVNTPVDFHLRSDSPAVDAGAAGKDGEYLHRSMGNAPDLGAIELGDTWELPRPGPTWAVGEKTPWRPPLPPSIEPEWVGLG